MPYSCRRFMDNLYHINLPYSMSQRLPLRLPEVKTAWFGSLIDSGGFVVYFD